VYVAVGHLTIDVLADGRHRAGGTVLFGALTAELGGSEAHVLTAAAANVDALLPDVTELTVARFDTRVTTTFVNRGTDRERVQELLAWAGPVPLGHVLDRATVVHLGPVAQELEPAWLDAAPEGAVVLLTPQGLIRAWVGSSGGAPGDMPGPISDGAGAVVHRLIDPAWGAAIARPVVVVLNASELAWVGDLGERAVAAGGALVVTDGHRPITVRTAVSAVEIEPRAVMLKDDTGAGDVFAAALGVALADGRDTVDAVRMAADAVAAVLPEIHALLPVA